MRFAAYRKYGQEKLEQRIVLDATAELVFDFQTEIHNGDAVIVDDVVYFPADDGRGDVELWKSDGSIGGTTRVKDIRVGRSGSIPQQLRSAQGLVYFTAYDDQHGRELWVSDGSEDGTLRLTDSAVDLRVGSLVEMGELVYFNVQGPDLSQIWQSDGTASGTLAITTDFPVSQFFHPIESPDHADGLLVVSNGAGLWVVDPATMTSTQVFDEAGVNGIYVLGDHILFRVVDGAEQWLHRVDLDAMQTEEVLSLGTSQLIGPVEFQGDYVYAVLPEVPGPLQVFRSDGTNGGKAEILSIDSDVRDMQIHSAGDRLYFTIPSGSTGPKLWTSDGTADGTEPYLASVNGVFGAATSIGSDLYIQAWNEEDVDYDIWKFPADFGPHSVVDVQGGALFGMSFVGAVKDRLLFRNGQQFLITDGSQDGTQPLADDIPVLDSGCGICFDRLLGTSELFAVGDGLVIKTDPPQSLYRTDGSAASISRLETSGSINDDISSVAGDHLYFLDYTQSSFDLWALNPDGELGNLQPPGVTKLFVESLPDSSPAEELFYFQASSDASQDGSNVDHIWVSDGTNEGTQPVLELDEWISGAGRDLFQWKDSVVFHTEDGDLNLFDGSGVRTLLNVEVQGEMKFYPGESRFYLAYDQEFLASDGTVEGTSNIGLNEIYGIGGVVVGSRLYFISEDQNLWVSDGTPSTTRPVMEDAEFDARILLGKLGEDVFFVDSNDTVWITDGTAEGTTIVADEVNSPFILAGWPGAKAVAKNGHLYFIGRLPNDDFNNTELWRTDGTTEGTMQITDIAPGSLRANPKYMTELNGFLYFAADDGFRGSELWRYPIDPVPGDADGNGTVDFADFLRLSANFGMEEEALHSEGDFNYDGAVDFEDFLLLSANFGARHDENVENA